MGNVIYFQRYHNSETISEIEIETDHSRALL